METNKLFSIAEKHGITVDRFSLPNNYSVSVNYSGNMFIALDNDISGADEKVCLAHELGHCETMSFYNIYSPFDVRGKHERRANCWAIKKLIPKSRYISALKKGYDNIYSLAEYFGVTNDFMQKAVEYYKTEN